MLNWWKLGRGDTRVSGFYRGTSEIFGDAINACGHEC